MICYPEDATEAEISVINDYWALTDELSTFFLYTVKEIYDRNIQKNTRQVNYLTKKSSYVAPHPAFICRDCKRMNPVDTRTDYVIRIKNKMAETCPECDEKIRRHKLEESRKLLKIYKEEIFSPIDYLKNLNFEETLSLLSITIDKFTTNSFVGTSLKKISITGVEAIDQQILLSLIDKKALIDITNLPSDVKSANYVLYGSIEYTTSNNPINFSQDETILPGIYTSHLTTDEYSDVTELCSAFYQKLQSYNVSIEDAKYIHQIIMSIQQYKLNKLILDIENQYGFEIDKSKRLNSLLGYLADNYPPTKLYFTFISKVREAISFTHKPSTNTAAKKHIFTKFVDDYISYIERNNLELKKTWTLPSSIEISPFETLFSQLYLKDNADWNNLSTKDIISLWIENYDLSEDPE